MKYPQSTIHVGLGARLAQLRTAKGLSQADIVQGELSRAYVSAVERGRITPSLQALELIASRIGEPISVILGEAATSAQGIMPAPGILQLEQALFRVITTGAPLPEGEVSAAEEVGPEGQLLAAYVSARSRQAGGDHAGAIAAARQGLDVLQASRRLGRELWQLWFGVAIGFAQLGLGSVSAAISHLEEAARGLSAAEGGEPFDATLLLAAHSGLLQALRAGGHTSRLTSLADEVEPDLPGSLIETLGFLYRQRIGSASAGQAQSGPWSTRLIWAKLLEHIRLSALAWQEIALVRQRAGEEARAERALSCAVDLAEIAGAYHQAAQSVNALAAHQLEAGRLEAAATTARRGVAIAERQESPAVRGQALAMLARIAYARNESEEAARLYAEAIKLMEGADHAVSKDLSDAYFSYGRLLVGQGRVEEGVKLLERAYVATQRREARV